MSGVKKRLGKEREEFERSNWGGILRFERNGRKSVGEKRGKVLGRGVMYELVEFGVKDEKWG